MITMATEELKTRDLALTTFLKLEGHAPARLELIQGGERPFAIWVFERNASLEALINDYENGNAQVEPLAFTRETRSTRDELYQYLNDQNADGDIRANQSRA